MYVIKRINAMKPVFLLFTLLIPPVVMADGGDQRGYHLALTSDFEGTGVGLGYLISDRVALRLGLQYRFLKFGDSLDSRYRSDVTVRYNFLRQGVIPFCDTNLSVVYREKKNTAKHTHDTDKDFAVAAACGVEKYIHPKVSVEAKTGLVYVIGDPDIDSYSWSLFQSGVAISYHW